ncbi:MAG: alpha/beta hydrolase [Clostridia bacterium]|nr:alpha/beta hydrolase [Clostridia bacterium]
MKKAMKICLIVLAVLLVVFTAVILFFFQFTHGRKEMDLESMGGNGSVWQNYIQSIDACNAWLAERETEEVSITSFDGLQLYGTYIPAEEAKACMILMHGYRSTGIQDFSGLIPFYGDNGYSILLIDQRACGRSEGKCISFGVNERIDAQSWAEYMDGRLEGKMPIILHGLSLGGATVMMAADLPMPASVRGIISDCGFTSPYDIIAHCGKAWFHIPAFPMVDILSGATELLGGFGYRDCTTLDTLAESDLPILLIHGGKDDFVPTYMTEENYAAAKNCKGKLIVPEAGHALSYITDPDAYRQAVTIYLEEILT